MVSGLSHKFCKDGSSDNRQKTGDGDGEAAHGALYLSELHCLCGSDSVGGGADGKPLCNWFFNAEDLAKQICQYVAENSCDDDNSDRYGFDAAEFL